MAVKPFDSLTDTLHRLATGSAELKRRLTPVVGSLFFVLIFGFLAGGVALDQLLSLPSLPARPFSLGLGLALSALGVGLSAWSVRAFRAMRGTPVPVNPPPSLVVSGPYAFARNPMITGLLVAMFGIGLLLGSPGIVFVTTPVFTLLHATWIKQVEEPELERRLGEPYIDYRRRTPMLFPHDAALRWLFVLPMASITVPLVDEVVAGLMNRWGVAVLSPLWVVGKTIGNFATGALGVMLGVFMAPGHKRSTAVVLLVIALGAAAWWLLNSGLPLHVAAPLNAALMGGAGGAAAVVWRRYAGHRNP
jgi:protein-S-isoprenylcysteine O-methyltransferase Ste14